MKKFTILLLTMIILLSGTVGCSSKKESIKESIFTGTHRQEVIKTERFLLKNGATDYQIVIPQEFNSNENLAAQEIQVLFEEGTNVRLSIITDENLTFSNNCTYISVGNTSLKEQAEIADNEESLGINGFAIKTVGNTIFIVGGTECGVLYGAYEFLYQILNFEQFFKDAYSLDKMVSDIQLMNYNIKELPDIKRYQANVGALTADATMARRMRAYYTPQNANVWVGGQFGHTSFGIIPPADYRKDHDEWFSDDGTQLCYTAHGVQEEYDLMIQTYADKVKELIIENQDKINFTIGDQDTLSRCQCDACEYYFNIYKCASASKIIFINKVMDILSEWYETEDGRKYYNPDFTIRLQAYYYYEQAPVKLNEKTGEYEPIDDKVVLRPGLGVEIAPIFTNFTASYFEDENISYYNNMKSWKALIQDENRILIWAYGYNADYFMYFINTIDTIPEHYQIYASIGTSLFTDQSQGANYDGLSAWYSLRTYLQTKLAWNTNLNIEELTQRFFDNYFGEASDIMMQFYKSQRTFNVYQQEVLGYCDANYSVKFIANKREYWPRGILEGWRSYIDQALEKIEPLKVKNNEKYQKLYKRIVAERVAIDFILLDLYPDQLGEKYDTIVAEFTADVALNNISFHGESGKSMSKFINGL